MAGMHSLCHLKEFSSSNESYRSKMLKSTLESLVCFENGLLCLFGKKEVSRMSTTKQSLVNSHYLGSRASFC